MDQDAGLGRRRRERDPAGGAAVSRSGRPRNARRQARHAGDRLAQAAHRILRGPGRHAGAAAARRHAAQVPAAFPVGQRPRRRAGDAVRDPGPRPRQDQPGRHAPLLPVARRQDADLLLQPGVPARSAGALSRAGRRRRPRHRRRARCRAGRRPGRHLQGRRLSVAVGPARHDVARRDPLDVLGGADHPVHRPSDRAPPALDADGLPEPRHRPLRHVRDFVPRDRHRQRDHGVPAGDPGRAGRRLRLLLLDALQPVRARRPVARRGRARGLDADRGPGGDGGADDDGGW